MHFLNDVSKITWQSILSKSAKQTFKGRLDIALAITFSNRLYAYRARNSQYGKMRDRPQ